jgi:DHA1 family bicyclomycin/chloramphenicol resistance-like MFS transporter
MGCVAVSVLVRKYTSAQLIRWGLKIMLFATVMFFLDVALHVHHLLFVVVPMAIFLCGIGLALPATKTMAMTSVSQNVGTAASLMKFIQVLISVGVMTLAAHSHASTTLLPISLLLLSVVIIGMLAFYMLSEQKLTD